MSKNNILKRFLAALLAVALLVGMLPPSLAVTAETTETIVPFDLPDALVLRDFNAGAVANYVTEVWGQDGMQLNMSDLSIAHHAGSGSRALRVELEAPASQWNRSVMRFRTGPINDTHFDEIAFWVDLSNAAGSAYQNGGTLIRPVFYQSYPFWGVQDRITGITFHHDDGGTSTPGWAYNNGFVVPAGFVGFVSIPFSTLNAARNLSYANLSFDILLMDNVDAGHFYFDNLQVRTAGTPFLRPTGLPPVVESVTVTPDTQEISVGQSYTFNAAVNGQNFPSQAVTWAVEGNINAGTVITSEGVLTVHADETATTLTVIATSVENTAVSGTATATVTTLPPTVTSVVVTPDGITLRPGASHTFSAEVSGQRNPPQYVEWSIEDNNHAETVITSGGVLTVHEDETAAAITVIATSDFDNTKYGEAAVIISGIPRATMLIDFETGVLNNYVTTAWGSGFASGAFSTSNLSIVDRHTTNEESRVLRGNMQRHTTHGENWGENIVQLEIGAIDQYDHIAFWVDFSEAVQVVLMKANLLWPISYPNFAEVRSPFTLIPDGGEPQAGVISWGEMAIPPGFVGFITIPLTAYLPRPDLPGRLQEAGGFANPNLRFNLVVNNPLVGTQFFFDNLQAREADADFINGPAYVPDDDDDDDDIELETRYFTVSTSNVPMFEANFQLGISHTHYWWETYDPIAVQSAKDLMAEVATIHNVHIMGWGSRNPWPHPDRPMDFTDIRNRIDTFLAIDPDAEIWITLCQAPGWMKGDDPNHTYQNPFNHRLDWDMYARPRPENMPHFAYLSARIAEAFPEAAVFQVWNEFKGFWLPGGLEDYALYTHMYNLIYDAIMDVRPDARVGGPYMIIPGDGTYEAFGVETLPLRGGEMHSRRPMFNRHTRGVEYFLENAVHTDYLLAVRNNVSYFTDGFWGFDGTTNTWHTGTWRATRDQGMQLTYYFNHVTRELAELADDAGMTQLPIVWSEFYGTMGDAWSDHGINTPYKGAHYASIYYNMIMGAQGRDVIALLWIEWQDVIRHSIFTDTNFGGGQPTPHGEALQLMARYFPQGTQLYQVAVSADEARLDWVGPAPQLEVMASAAHVFVINKTDGIAEVLIDGIQHTLDPYEVAVFEREDIDTREDLGAAIAHVRGLNNTNFTRLSWALLHQVYMQAVALYNNENATAQALEDMTARLWDAIDALVSTAPPPPPEADKAPLIAAIATAETFVVSEFTRLNWVLLQDALNHARLVAGNEYATQEQVNVALSRLNVAKDSRIT
ncbi:MAG: hypothetical protein FWC77_03260 [Defluviitaleaceae bacterium]|nr:hypothetical protein [Defluviitaleaceae bacterium]